MKLLDYKNWKRRNLLVLKMLTSSDLLENSLDLLEIPNITYDCVEENDLESRWEKDKDSVCGIIISGSRTVPEYDFMPSFPEKIIKDLPALGICYGNELLGQELGSNVVNCNQPVGEKGSVIAKLHKDPIFAGIDTSEPTIVTMNHDQMLDKLPPGAILLASTEATPVAGFKHSEKSWWGLQFHPEKDWMGTIIFRNFYKICRK